MRDYTLLGQTVDDAAGEAFDKAARVLGLNYPGGPLLSRLAEGGDAHFLTLPHPHPDGKYDFSFSGLKTAFLNACHKMEQKGEELAPGRSGRILRAGRGGHSVRKSFTGYGGFRAVHPVHRGGRQRQPAAAAAVDGAEPPSRASACACRNCGSAPTTPP